MITARFLFPFLGFIFIFPFYSFLISTTVIVSVVNAEQLFQNSIQASGWLEYIGRLAIHGNVIGIIPDIIDRLEQQIHGSTFSSPSSTSSFSSFSPLRGGSQAGERKLIMRAISELQNMSIAATSSNQGETPIQIGKGKELLNALTDGDLKEANFEQFVNIGALQVNANYRPISLILSLVDYDLRMKGAALALWRPSYGLSMEQMIDILKFARSNNSCGSIPEESSSFESIPYANLIRARIMINMNCPFDIERNISDPVERNLLQAGRFQKMREYCHGSDAIKEALSKAPLTQQAELVNLKERATRLCNWHRITRTYKAYCQHGRSDDLPISEATSGLGSLSPSLPSTLSSGCPKSCIRRMEKLFWAKVWAGDCNGAFSELNDLRTLLKKENMLCHPLINSRLEYMRTVQTDCSGKQVYHFTTDAAAQIFEKLKKDDIAGAQQHWYDVYRSTPNYIEAKNLLMAILIYKHPKAAYSPCLESSLLTGNQDLDLPFLRLVDDVFEGRPRTPCHPYDHECHSERMKAHYVTGDMKGAELHASKIPDGSPFALRALQMSACLNLCSKYRNPDQLCRANDQFRLILHQLGDLNHEHIVMGQRLAHSICDAGNKPVADLTSLKYGNILIPMEPIFDRIRNILNIIPFIPSSSMSRKESSQKMEKSLGSCSGGRLKKFSLPCKLCTDSSGRGGRARGKVGRMSKCSHGPSAIQTIKSIGGGMEGMQTPSLPPLPKFSMLEPGEGMSSMEALPSSSPSSIQYASPYSMPKFTMIDDYSAPMAIASSMGSPLSPSSLKIPIPAMMGRMTTKCPLAIKSQSLKISNNLGMIPLLNPSMSLNPPFIKRSSRVSNIDDDTMLLSQRNIEREPEGQYSLPFESRRGGTIPLASPSQYYNDKFATATNFGGGRQGMGIMGNYGSNPVYERMIPSSTLPFNAHSCGNGNYYRSEMSREGGMQQNPTFSSTNIPASSSFNSLISVPYGGGFYGSQQMNPSSLGFSPFGFNSMQFNPMLSSPFNPMLPYRKHGHGKKRKNRDEDEEDADEDADEKENRDSPYSMSSSCNKKSKKKSKKVKENNDNEVEKTSKEIISKLKAKGAPCSGLSSEIRKDMEPVIKKIEKSCRKNVKSNAKHLMEHSKKLVNALNNQISRDEMDSEHETLKYKWVQVPLEPETTNKPPKGYPVFGGPADPDRLNPPEKVPVPPEGAKIVGGPLSNTAELDKGEPKDVLEGGEGEASMPPEEGEGEELGGGDAAAAFPSSFISPTEGGGEGEDPSNSLFGTGE